MGIDHDQPPEPGLRHVATGFLLGLLGFGILWSLIVRYRFERPDLTTSALLASACQEPVVPAVLAVAFWELAATASGLSRWLLALILALGLLAGHVLFPLG